MLPTKNDQKSWQARMMRKMCCSWEVAGKRLTEIEGSTICGCCCFHVVSVVVVVVVVIVVVVLVIVFIIPHCVRCRDRGQGQHAADQG